MVTVWKPHHGHGSHALLARFSPVLYVHAVLAGTYFLICTGLMIYHHVEIHMVASGLSSSSTCSTVSSCLAPKPKGVVYLQDMEDNTTMLNTIEEEEDLEAMLRNAKQQQGL